MQRTQESTQSTQEEYATNTTDAADASDSTAKVQGYRRLEAMSCVAAAAFVGSEPGSSYILRQHDDEKR